MRRGLFLFLIVLTLLRGLVGPAMAAGMALPHGAGAAASQESVHPAEYNVHGVHSEHATHEQHAMAMEQASHPHTGNGMHCPGAQATPASDLTDHASACSDAGTAHTACADCDICHTAVMAPAALRSPFDARVGAGPDLRSTRFASALPAQATKPPIS